MAEETGPPRSKYPPPKPPAPAPNPPQAQRAAPAGYPQQAQPGYPQQQGYAPQQPGYGPGGVRAPAKPSAYWPLSIISFILSFLFGAIAIYFSAQVGSRWRVGNVQGAEKASRMALIWGIVGVVVGLIVFFAVIGSESGTSY
jgi:interferon-induced transmembrane protein